MASAADTTGSAALPAAAGSEVARHAEPWCSAVWLASAYACWFGVSIVSVPQPSVASESVIAHTDPRKIMDSERIEAIAYFPCQTVGMCDLCCANDDVAKSKMRTLRM